MQAHSRQVQRLSPQSHATHDDGALAPFKRRSEASLLRGGFEPKSKKRDTAVLGVSPMSKCRKKEEVKSNLHAEQGEAQIVVP